MLEQRIKKILVRLTSVESDISNFHEESALSAEELRDISMKYWVKPTLRFNQFTKTADSFL